MSSNLSGLNVHISGTSVPLQQAVQRANASLNTIGTTSTNAFRRLNVAASSGTSSVNALGGAFKGLGGALGSVGLGVSTAALVGMGIAALHTADSLKALQARVKASLTDVSQFNSVWQSLIASANRSGTSLDATASSFVRINGAAKDLGFNTQGVVRFTETFSKMGAIAGASGEDTKNALVQIAQGLASGKLQGDELKSVMETMPDVGRAIARSMGIPFEEFKKKASEGKVTAYEVFKAIVGESEKVDRQFAKLPVTMDRSWSEMSNNLTLLLGTINEMTGSTQRLAEAFKGVSDALKGVNEGIIAFDKWGKGTSQDRVNQVQGELNTLKQAKQIATSIGATDWLKQLNENEKHLQGQLGTANQNNKPYFAPVAGTVTSGFGHRPSPGGVGSTNHKGLDIAAPKGAPVKAVTSGELIQVYTSTGGGKTVVVKNDDGFVNKFLHLSQQNVKVGQRVSQGDLLGRVGSTGTHSTGPHLHYQVERNGQAVDPRGYLSGVTRNPKPSNDPYGINAAAAKNAARLAREQAEKDKKDAEAIIKANRKINEIYEQRIETANKLRKAFGNDEQYNREVAAAKKERDEALKQQEEQSKAFKDRKKLQEEFKTLLESSLTAEQKSAEIQKQINFMEKAGIGTAAERKQILQSLNKEVLEKQLENINEVGSAQDIYNKKLAITTEYLEKGKISQSLYNEKIKEISDEATKSAYQNVIGLIDTLTSASAKYKDLLEDTAFSEKQGTITAEEANKARDKAKKQYEEQIAAIGENKDAYDVYQETLKKIIEQEKELKEAKASGIDVSKQETGLINDKKVAYDHS